jgi:hypothetical protein
MTTYSELLFDHLEWHTWMIVNGGREVQHHLWRSRSAHPW